MQERLISQSGFATGTFIYHFAPLTFSFLLLQLLPLCIFNNLSCAALCMQTFGTILALLEINLGTTDQRAPAFLSLLQRGAATRMVLITLLYVVYTLVICADCRARNCAENLSNRLRIALAKPKSLPPRFIKVNVMPWNDLLIANVIDYAPHILCFLYFPCILVFVNLVCLCYSL